MSLSIVNDLEIRWAKSQIELLLAMDVSLDSFYPDPTDTDRRISLKQKWELDPFFKPEFLLIAVRGNEILGGIRTIPLTIMRQEQEFRCLGICEIFVAREHQNLGIADRLVSELLELMNNTNYELILSVTRRKIDGFYLKKGFFGIGSYSQIQISDIKKSMKFIKCNFEPIEITSIEISDQLNQLYEDSYKNVFGRRKRSTADWSYIQKRNQTERKSSFGIWIKNELVGYLIISQNEIHELSFSSKIDPASLIYGISEHLGADSLVLSISTGHSLLAKNLGFDIRTIQRECFYGGHILKIINAKSIIEKFKARENHILNQLGMKIIDLSIDGVTYSLNLIDNEIQFLSSSRQSNQSKKTTKLPFLTYELTKLLLGISSNYGKSEVLEFGFSEEVFHISKIDEF